jgi:hypothetical protein
MLAHKVLLPGASLLERLVAKLRSRVEAPLWRILGKAITPEGRSRPEDLLRVPEAGSQFLARPVAPGTGEG